jgi:hypothetical protein
LASAACFAFWTLAAVAVAAKAAPANGNEPKTIRTIATSLVIIISIPPARPNPLGGNWPA